MRLVADLQDPTNEFEENNSPADLSKEEQASITNLKMWEMCMKHYLDR